MKLEPDLREFIELLNARKVRYIVVGAYALAFHGRPRYTGDIDFFDESSSENAQRISEVIEEFGLVNIGLAAADFTAVDQVVQLGVDPNRIDLMTSLSGVTFDEAWDTREQGELDGIPVQYISKDLLKRNKTAVGRKQDIADLDYL
jgi:predicted nucleotidyltransferase